MSVAIVTPQTKTPAPASARFADSASSTDTTASGADFANLLLGQLAAGVSFQPAIPDRTAPPADGSKDIITELAPQDAALMLAALGIAPKTMEAQAPAKAENALLPGISGKGSAIAPGTVPDNALGTDQNAATGNDSSNFILPVASGAEDKPAKVAVADPTLLKTEAHSVGDPAMAGLSQNISVTALRNEEVLKVETPVHDHKWAGDFTQKIVWLASNDKQVAQLTLNPPQMGPIEISLNLDKDGASAFFVSQNADVREAIETALPRLREMLASAGIELGQANVSAESFRQQAGNEEARQGKPRWMADNAILGSDSARSLSGQAVIAQRGNGLVDIFA